MDLIISVNWSEHKPLMDLDDKYQRWESCYFVKIIKTGSFYNNPWLDTNPFFITWKHSFLTLLREKVSHIDLNNKLIN